jgi:segregation and condensation protein B
VSVSEARPGAEHGAPGAESGTPELDELARILESLLFLSAEPASAEALAEAADVEPGEVATALEALRAHYEQQGHGLVLRELAGGYALSSHPDAELAARRLLAKPRTPPLTAAQAETLAIIAYLQPVSRPEIARIRGVSAESAAATLLERGMIEEAGRSQFGAVMYRTTDLFLKLFGLPDIGSLPEIEGFDPSPEFEQELRDRLLQAGEVRAGVAGLTATGPTPVPDLEASAVPDYEGHHEAADEAAARDLARAAEDAAHPDCAGPADDAGRRGVAGAGEGASGPSRDKHPPG